MTHEISIETTDVNGVPRHRAVCSCGRYRSVRERYVGNAEGAGWQHQRRMGSPVGKPGVLPRTTPGGIKTKGTRIGQ